MTNSRNKEIPTSGLIITPPQEPLRLPLEAHQICEIFGISKSTLFRWENDRLIPRPERDLTRLLSPRLYGPTQIVGVLRVLQDQHVMNPRLHPWLDTDGFDPYEDIELDKPFELTLPSGFTITIQPEPETA